LVEQRIENPCGGSSNLFLDKMENYLCNMLSKIKNAQLARKTVVFQKKNKISENFLKLLWNEGFILGYTLRSHRLKIFLKYAANRPAIHSLRVVSKPSRRIFYSIKQVWKINSSKSFIVLSTNQGLKSLLECKKKNIGGELLIVVN
jgi:small subunit ribosomal protein S8